MSIEYHKCIISIDIGERHCHAIALLNNNIIGHFQCPLLDRSPSVKASAFSDWMRLLRCAEMEICCEDRKQAEAFQKHFPGIVTRPPKQTTPSISEERRKILIDQFKEWSKEPPLPPAKYKDKSDWELVKKMNAEFSTRFYSHSS